MILSSSLLNSGTKDAAAQKLAKYEPRDGKLFIIGQDVEAVPAYNKATSPKLAAGFAGYTSVNKADGLSRPAADGLQWSQYFVDRFPGTVLQLAAWMDYEHILDEVIAGEHDGTIKELADFIKAAKRPVYLRIGYEFDSEWNALNTRPYGQTAEQKRKKAQKFIQAYKYVVDRLREMEVNNVAYVWHSYAQKFSLPNAISGWGGVMEWYPGDEYVDWFAVSYFERSMNSCIAAREYVAQLAREHNKPLMIAESACIRTKGVHDPQVWEKWFEPYFEYIKKNDVKAVSYISVDWDALALYHDWEWGDTRVQENPEVFAKWLKEINDGSYIFSSPELYNTLGFTKE